MSITFVEPPALAADPFVELNDEQRAAVMHGAGDDHPPLLVVAGAGSGKTTMLAARVARLILGGADPARIMLLCFSRRAALDMQRRVGQTLHRAMQLSAAQPAPRLSWAGTFHGIAARLLRDHAARIGLPDDFTILDRGDSEDLLGVVRHELGLSRSARRFPLKGTCMAIYSRVVNSGEALPQVLERHYPWCSGWAEELRQLFRAYAIEKQQQHGLDYDDLLLYWQHMLGDAGLAGELGERFQHVLVDEYQDTNHLQSRILLALKPLGRGLSVVGDDAQSIYSFRAADVRNMLDFPRQFEPAATVLSLQRNYRSTPAILNASNALMAAAGERFAKTLWNSGPAGLRPRLVQVADEAAQASWVADQVLAQREGGVALKRQAVLFRAAHHSAALELELTRRHIPFVKFGGLRFLEATHVKDLLSVLRWQHNPRCRSAGLRVAQLVPGVGAATAHRLLERMQAADDPRAAMSGFEPPPRAAAGWCDLVRCFVAMSDAAARWPAAIEVALHWYLPQLQRLHADAAARRTDLEQLVRMAGAQRCCAQFLAELTLDPPAASSDEAAAPHRDEDYLVLSTIHSAKGQEWSAVIVLNVVDGCMPSDMATGDAAQIDEERRLLYVAMTRAQHQLDLLVPQRFYVTQQAARGDRHLYALPSRFITPAVARCLDSVVAAPPDPAQPSRGPFALDVAAQVRSIWD